MAHLLSCWLPYILTTPPPGGAAADEDEAAEAASQAGVPLPQKRCQEAGIAFLSGGQVEAIAPTADNQNPRAIEGRLDTLDLR
jgi:hypothetical protein